MTGDTRNISSVSSHHVLSRDEAARRLLLLADLQIALTKLGVRCVLARYHRLVLRWYSSGPFGPSGLTDPQLHIFTSADAVVATTDGTTFYLTTGQQCPADDPAAAAEHILDCAVFVPGISEIPVAAEERQ
jgi:hypothetical protein